MKKNKESLIEKIERFGKQYNSSLTRIGVLLAELAEMIDEILPEELGNIEFQHGNLLFSRVGKYSNIGRLGPSFWFVDYDEEIGEYLKGLVSTTRKPGSEFFLHNDFNCKIAVAGRVSRRKAAEQIAEFLEKFAEHLEKLSEKSQIAEKNLSEIVEKFKKVVKES